MKKMFLLALVLFSIEGTGCFQQNDSSKQKNEFKSLLGGPYLNISNQYRKDAVNFGTSWMQAFQVLGVSGFAEERYFKVALTEMQPELDRLKGDKGDEKSIYQAALFVTDALKYVSDNLRKPPSERFKDEKMNKVLGIQKTEFTDEEIARIVGTLLLDYEELCGIDIKKIRNQ